jgi:hypothetical protein
VVRVGYTVEDSRRDSSGGSGRGCVHVLQKSPTKPDDGTCRIDGDACKEREVLATVGESGDVFGRGMREKNQGQGRHLST